MSSLENALSILSMLSAERPVLRVGEIARDSGLPKSTVSRLLKTLATFEMLERESGDQGYVAGRRITALAQLSAVGTSLPDRLDSVLVQLATQFGFAGYVCVLAESDVLILKVRNGTYPLRLVRNVGERMRPQDTSVGAALLALHEHGAGSLRPGAADQIRRHGMAWGRSNVIPGVAAMASAVHNPTTGESAGISVSFPMAAADRATRDAMASWLREQTAAVGAVVADPYWMHVRPDSLALPDLSDEGFGPNAPGTPVDCD